MYDLLVAGGLYFTLPLTVLAVAVLALAVKKAIDLFTRPARRPAALKPGLDAIIQLGGFSFFFGLFAQAVSLYQMMTAIEAAGDVSPPLVAGGLKWSLIAPIYGLLILLVAALCWFALNMRFKMLVAGMAAPED